MGEQMSVPPHCAPTTVSPPNIALSVVVIYNTWFHLVSWDDCHHGALSDSVRQPNHANIDLWLL